MSALLRAFAEEPGSVAARITDCDAVATAELLAALYARGRAAHPRVVVSEQAFGQHLARCANGGSPGNTASLAEIAAEDVYLACACAARVRGAAAAFEARYGRVIRRAVSRVLDTADERQEAEQRAWQHLLAALKPRERLVMKLFLVSGMTLDAIGKSLGITRQAVSKTLARARETIVERVQASVQQTLKMTKEDLTSVLRYVASQLDVSISRVLGKS